MILIRVSSSYSAGIGHLTRTLKLAKYLSPYFKIKFLVDADNDVFRRFTDNQFEVVQLYYDQRTFQNELEDAELTVCIIKDLKPQAIIIDDYRMGLAWESHVKKWVSHLIVFDDRDEVPHECSMLIDSKYVGHQTQNRYSGRVNLDCIKLLGPKFFLTSANGGQKKENKKLEKSILMSLGGGGDLSIFLEPIRVLLNKYNSKKLDSIYLVIGPYSINTDIFEQSIEDNRLVLIRNCTNLMPYIERCELYIGASGTTLFECLSVGCPALSFSIAENQKNDKKNFEDMGHYFHVNNFSTGMREMFTSLCLKVFRHRGRLKKLLDANNFGFDNHGGERITMQIASLLGLSNQVRTLNQANNSCQSCSYEMDSPATKRTFRKVGDRDVNKYLEARNQYINSKNMTVKTEIQEIEHYCWWFENSRESFVLENEGSPLLYIWHQLVKVRNSQHYLIGGWFVAMEKVSPIEIMSALKNQLETTATQYPNVTWLAVINKKNIFVKKLNEKYGFKKIYDIKKINIIEKIFPNANIGEFDYYEK